MFNYKKMCLTIIYSIFFSYFTDKTELLCANPRHTQCLKCFSYLLTAVHCIWQWPQYKALELKMSSWCVMLHASCVTGGGDVNAATNLCGWECAFSNLLLLPTNKYMNCIWRVLIRYAWKSGFSSVRAPGTRTDNTDTCMVSPEVARNKRWRRKRTAPWLWISARLFSTQEMT